MVATSSQIVVLIAGIANAGSDCGADAIGRSEPPLQNYKGAGFRLGAHILGLRSIRSIQANSRDQRPTACECWQSQSTLAGLGSETASLV